MKIVVLDGYTLNPGDLSWEPIEALGTCTIHPRTPPELVAERAAGAELVLTNKALLPAETIKALPGLRYIGVIATGYNVVDTAAARQHGVVVTHIPAYGTRSVAQMTFALMLELTRRAGHHAALTRAGRWSACEDWCFWEHPQVELDGLGLGLLGYGHIGRAVAEIARAAGMRVIACQPSKRATGEVDLVDADTLFATSDVVSLHCPLTANNKEMVDARLLGLMKPTAYLINTARGSLIHEQDLADALNAGRLAGAALDVLAVEPPLPDNPLLKAKNCIITPHIAWATRAARERLLATAAANIRAFVAGKPINVVNG